MFLPQGVAKMNPLVRLFRRPDYRSDTSDFLDELKRKQSDLPARQHAGRARLWQPDLPDAAQQQELLAGFKEAATPLQVYASVTLEQPA